MEKSHLKLVHKSRVGHGTFVEGVLSGLAIVKKRSDPLIPKGYEGTLPDAGTAGGTWGTKCLIK